MVTQWIRFLCAVERHKKSLPVLADIYDKGQFAQLCIKCVELSRSIGETRCLLLWAFNLFTPFLLVLKPTSSMENLKGNGWSKSSEWRDSSFGAQFPPPQDRQCDGPYWIRLFIAVSADCCSRIFAKFSSCHCHSKGISAYQCQKVSGLTRERSAWLKN